MAELMSVLAFVMAVGAVLGVISVAKKADAGATSIVNAQMIGIKKIIIDHQASVKEAITNLNKRIEKLEKDYQAARNSQAKASEALAGLERNAQKHATAPRADAARTRTGTG